MGEKDACENHHRSVAEWSMLEKTSQLISIGKGKAFRNHRQYQNNNKQDGRPYSLIKQ